MRRWAGRTLDLLRLRAGPQDLPHAPVALYAAIVLACAVDWLVIRNLDLPEAEPGRVLAGMAATLLLPWLVLAWARRAARYVQTMLALLLTGMVFSLAFLPLAQAILAQGPPIGDAAPTPSQGLLGWLLLALMVWKLVVAGSIWRHALDWRLGAATGLAMLLFVAEFLFDQLLFGAG